MNRAGLSADNAPPGAFEWSPGRQVIAAIRAYQRSHDSWIVRKIAVLRWRFWSAIAGCEIPLNARGLGWGIRIPHPNGIVIHPNAYIGPVCVVFQQVTIGTRHSACGAPRIGIGSEIGAGAKILGPVDLAPGTIVGANAVVTRSCRSAGQTIVGANRVITTKERTK